MGLQRIVLSIFAAILVLANVQTAEGRWIVRDHRWPPRGVWAWSLPRELPELYREFNGIDFGHAHLAETLLITQNEADVEKARLEVLEFIFSSPVVPPDEEQIAPTFTRMVWEVQKVFNWAHTFHRSLYDLFAAENVKDKESAYQKLLANYLEKPEAITSYPLDLHGKLWSWPESKSFSRKFPKFNSQIWAYHWLQAASYDVQLAGDAEKQRSLLPSAIKHYHGYLHNPPTEWTMMPMMTEAAPEFAKRFPGAAAIFDNLHMLHDNVDDVLSSPDMYGSHKEKRDQILRILDIYLHKNHSQDGIYRDYRMSSRETHGHGMSGPRPPSAYEVLGIVPPHEMNGGGGHMKYH